MWFFYLTIFIYMKLIDLFNEILKEADNFNITRGGNLGTRVTSKIANVGKQLTPGFIRSPKEYKGIGGARLANKNVETAADSIGFQIPRSKQTRDDNDDTVDKITISFSVRDTYSGFQYLKVSVDDYQKIKEIFRKGNVSMKTYPGKPDLFSVDFNTTNNKYLVSFKDIFYNKKSPTSGIIYTPNTYDMQYLSPLDLNDIVNKDKYKKFQFPLIIINKP